MKWKLFAGVMILLLLTACAGNTNRPVASQVDSDGDGVIDGLDRCPASAPGMTVDSDGCGIDSDLDGVFDHLDRCSGTVINVPVDIHGCPLDSDDDGVADDQDRCADTPVGAKVDPRGCLEQVVKKVEQPIKKPIVKPAPKPAPAPHLELMVLFRTGHAELLAGNEPEFKRGTDFIKRYPGARVVIEGHTDSVGPDAFNLTLSEKRAVRVSQELTARLKQDAPDISVKGYGETRPIADNETQQGREKNRRVVIRIETAP